MKIGATDVLHTIIGELKSKKVIKMKNRFYQISKKSEASKSINNSIVSNIIYSTTN